MGRFVEGEERRQSLLLPETLDDYVTEDNPVRVVEVFIDELDLGSLGFEGMEPAATGRPAYHPWTMLKIYLNGYLNRVQSSRRLEREAGRNIELMWLTGRLGCRRHRRQQVQGGEQSRQELHRGQGGQAPGAGRRQHRALPGGPGPG